MSDVDKEKSKKTKADLIREGLNQLRALACQVKEKAFLLTSLPAQPATAENRVEKESSNFNEEVLRAISCARDDLHDALAVLNDFI